MNAQLDIFAPQPFDAVESLPHFHIARVTVQAPGRTIDVCTCGAARETRGADVGAWCGGIEELSTNARLVLAGYTTTCTLEPHRQSVREVRDASGAVVFTGGAEAVSAWLKEQGR